MKTFLLLFSFNLGTLFAQQLQDSLQTEIQLKGVTVAALSATEQTPMAFSDVTKEELAQRNLGADLPVLLNFLPGVVTTSDAGAGVGYTGIRVRGSDATRVNVTINGIPYNDSESQGTFWVDLPDFSSSVESLQLQRGVGTSTNGSGAFGASLNITTDAVSKNAYAQFAHSFGSFATQKHTLKFSTGLLDDRFELSGRLSKIDSDGYVDRASSDLKSYFLQAVYQEGKTQIKALAFGGHERTYQSWFGVDADTLKENRTYNPAGANYDSEGNIFGYYDDQVDNYDQDHYQLHFNQQINLYWTLGLGLNYTYGRGYYQEINDLWYDQNVDFSGKTAPSYLALPSADAQATENITQKWLDNDFYVANINARFQKNNNILDLGVFHSKYVGDHFGVLLWAEQTGGALPGHLFYENRGIKKDSNLFGKLTHGIGDRLVAYADLQYRWVDYAASGVQAGPEPINIDRNYGFFNPKFGLTYNLNNTSKAYVSVARAHREPNRTDFENGNPVPESLTDFELGYRMSSETFKWGLNLYYMDYKNQLVLTGAVDEVGAPIRENSGSSYRLGLEWDADLYVSSTLRLNTNLTLSDNKNRDFVFERDGQLQELGNTHLSYSPSVVGAGQIIYTPSESLTISLFTKHVGEQYMGNIDAKLSKLPSYTTQDIGVQYELDAAWCKSLTFQLLLNNVFDANYVSNGYFYTYDDTWSNPEMVQTIEGAGYYPQAGFHFLTGVTVRF
jgi:iron complex outermembrane receptor protein